MVGFESFPDNEDRVDKYWTRNKVLSWKRSSEIFSALLISFLVCDVKIKTWWHKSSSSSLVSEAADRKGFDEIEGASEIRGRRCTDESSVGVDAPISRRRLFRLVADSIRN